MTAAAAHEFPGRRDTSKDWIYMRDIYVDPRYQRPLDEGRVVRMQETFDPDALGLPFVVAMPQPGGKARFAIIDGQHRVEAARRVFGDKQMIECEVVRGVSLERAAQLFELRNQSRKPKAIDLFLASVTAGNEEAIAINKIVHSAGLVVSRSRTDHVVQGVAAMQKVYRGDRLLGTGKNPLPLKRTLLILDEAWGPSPDAYRAELIEGLGWLLIRHGEIFDGDHMIRRLKEYPGGPLKFAGDVAGYRGVAGGNQSTAASTVLTNLYNKGRKKNTLPKWGKGNG